MAKVLEVTLLREKLSEDFNIAFAYVKQFVPDLKVNLLCAPLGLNYSVPSPVVVFKDDNSEFNFRREYGREGLSLVQDVVKGKKFF